MAKVTINDPLTAPKVPGLKGRASSTRKNLKPGNTMASGSASAYKPPKLPYPGRSSSKRKNLGGPGVGQGPKPTPTPAPQPVGAKPTGPPPVQPFLTPDQQNSLNQAWYSTQGTTNSLNSQLGNAKIGEAQTLYQNAKTALQNTAAENNSAAAKGMFQSSVNDGALNDIAATQAYNDNLAKTNLAGLSSNISAQISAALSLWGKTQSVADEEAVENAQNATPITKNPPNAAGFSGPPGSPTNPNGQAKVPPKVVAGRASSTRHNLGGTGVGKGGGKSGPSKAAKAKVIAGRASSTRKNLLNKPKAGAKPQKYGNLK